ncbi:MAG TPA: phage tail protein [Thermoanaerobaculia bacterium]|jgi:microcystin-dependent protein|nr:phage tail protein [Thermoanaerobaculia bacterium]
MSLGPAILSPFPQTQVIPVGVPVGAVIPYAGPIDEGDSSQAPPLRQILAAQGWLVCDGSLVPISQFPVLAALLGNAYGNQENGQFRLPDYRGVFLRGVNGNREPPNDPDAGNRTGSGPGGEGNTGNHVGSLQKDQFQEHEHQYTAATVTNKFQSQPEGLPAVMATAQSTTTAVVCKPRNETPPCFGAETRPLNIYVYFLIKAAVDVLAFTVPPPASGFAPLRGGFADTSAGASRTSDQIFTSFLSPPSPP